MTESAGSSLASPATAEFVSVNHLVRIMPGCSRALATQYVAPLNAAMLRYDINSPRRWSCFLAQIAHESGQLRHCCEVWGPTPAQRGYDMRRDLGNTQPGDGERYKGHGLIQITGRDMHRRCSLALYGDTRLLEQPQLLEETQAACDSAGWFWRDVKKLNPLADNLDMAAITRRINGGLNGFTERMSYFTRAKLTFGIGGT